MKRRWSLFLDGLLGRRCVRCRERVWPRDLASHEETNHAGDAGWVA